MAGGAVALIALGALGAVAAGTTGIPTRSPRSPWRESVKLATARREAALMTSEARALKRAAFEASLQASALSDLVSRRTGSSHPVILAPSTPAFGTATLT